MAKKELRGPAEAQGMGPASLELPMRPVVDQGHVNLGDPKMWPATRWETGPLTLEGASRSRQELSQLYRNRFAAGEIGAVRELLDRDPEFMREPWVREAVIRLMEHGRFDQRPQGRPRGRSREVLGYGLALVAFVDQQTKVTGRSRDALFRELANGGFASLGYEGIKALYRRTKNDDRLNPLLFVG